MARSGGIAQRALAGDQGPQQGVNRCSELPQFTKLTDRKRAPPSAKSGARRQAWGFRIGASRKSGLRERALIFFKFVVMGTLRAVKPRI